MKKDNEIFAVIPAYSQDGDNICYTILDNGETNYIPINIRKFLDCWLAQYKLTVPGRLRWAYFCIKSKILNPIVVTKDLVLVPVKVRRAIGSNDGCYAYVKLSCIADLNENQLILKNGTNINYLSSYRTIDNKIKQATLLRFIHISDLKDYLSDF